MQQKIFLIVLMYFLLGALPAGNAQVHPKIDASEDNYHRPFRAPGCAKQNIPLFRIEKNHNHNTVYYDANLSSDALIDEDKPMDVYWMHFATDSLRAELSWLDRNFGYGYSSKENKDGSRSIKLSAFKGRELMLTKDESGNPVAVCDINGKKAVLRKLYVFANPSRMYMDVVYVDVFGISLEGNKLCHERINR